MSEKRVQLDILTDIWGDNSLLSSLHRKIQSNKDATVFSLPINSGGGSVFEGIAVHGLMSGVNTETHVMGIAASMASAIAQSGKVRKMASNAFLMIHDPSALTYGNISDHKETLALLGSVKNSLVNIYSNRTGIERSEIEAMMEAETWFSAQEALDKGFIDEITEGIPFEANIDITKFTNVPVDVKNVVNNSSKNKMGNEKWMDAIKSLFVKNGKDDATADEAIESFMGKLTPVITDAVSVAIDGKFASMKADFDAQIAGVTASIDEKVASLTSNSTTALEAVVAKNTEQNDRIAALELLVSEMKDEKDKTDQILASLVGKQLPNTGSVPGATGVDGVQTTMEAHKIDKDAFDKLLKSGTVI